MDMEHISVATHTDLLQLYDEILCELRTRKILRSSNNPVADYAEWLAARALGLKLEGKSSTGFDGICQQGKRYEVKGRRRTPENNSAQLSAIRGLDKCHFDFLVGIVFKKDFTIDYAGLVPYAVVVERSVYRAHTNAWILQFKRDILNDTRVQDITKRIADAAVLRP
jgi:hypothetical protein